MTIVVTRDDRSQSGTHGTFELGGKSWHSLEREDLGNKPFESCVPLGTYDLVPFTSPKYGQCFIMVNQDLNVYAYEHSPGRPESGRYLCLFVHRGNYSRNFVGCMGASHDFLDESDMLASSTTKACEEVVELVHQEGSYRLEIRHVNE